MGRGNVSVSGPYEGLYYIDTADIDANDADCIVQFALLDKVVYG